jgi:ribosomal protein S18 acetylase RimI-like enzyme
VYVAPEMRGRRLFGRLIDEIARAAERDGAVELRLMVHPDNARAIAAYRHSGFEDLPYRVMRRRL